MKKNVVTCNTISICSKKRMETFSLVNDVYGDASMMIEGDGLEVSSSVEDFWST